MASRADVTSPPGLVHGPALPYPPSWVDALIRAIGQLPVPAWLFYAVLGLALYLLVNAIAWLEGVVRFGSFDAPYAFDTLYAVPILAAIHYLDATAKKAFDYFLPALGVQESEAMPLKYELTVLPAHQALLVAAVGFAFFLLLVNSGGPRPFLGSGLYYWTLILLATCGIILTAELVYHTVRQLRFVTRIHAIASNLDLFHYTPLYSFSALTARTGLVFSLILWFDLAINPETLNNPALIALNALILVLSAMCFVLPLEGMHRRIVVEKRRLEWDVDQRVKAIVGHLYGSVDHLALGDADAINKTISSLLQTRDLIGKIPTWPWRPQTFTAFFSALALPVIVFLIQMFFKTVIGFK